MAHSRKLKKAAEQFLALGHKVYHFRRDCMSEKQAQTLKDKLRDLQDAMKGKPGTTDDAAIQAKMDTLEPLMKKVGGRIYPKTFWNDNVEMLLVAAIVVIGIRTFIAQPFIIPTNSMYPTYAGVTHELYQEQPGPGGLKRLWNFATRGARYHEVTSPASGEIFIPYFNQGDSLPSGGSGSLRYREVPGRAFGIWPVTRRQYQIYVGTNGDHVSIRVPRSFSLDAIVSEQIQAVDRPGFPHRTYIRGQPFLRTGLEVQAGEPIFAFDIRLGDMLFVDRMSYHFKRPDIGDPFVFKTKKIPGLVDLQKNQEDKYYIKRLVGSGGDSLQVVEPTLLRNGNPIAGANAFEKNHRQIGDYEGYINANPKSYALRRGIPLPDGAMLPGHAVSIPEGFHYAMGDNSDSSLDSRSWGFVPEKSVIGRALFVYYPFSPRWGPAK